jgi:hypothetical protein
VKAYRNVTPPDALLGKGGYQQYVKDARDVSMRRLFDGMAWWRSNLTIIVTADLPVDDLMWNSAVKQRDVPVVNYSHADEQQDGTASARPTSPFWVHAKS